MSIRGKQLSKELVTDPLGVICQAGINNMVEGILEESLPVGVFLVQVIHLTGDRTSGNNLAIHNGHRKSLVTRVNTPMASHIDSVTHFVTEHMGGIVRTFSQDICTVRDPLGHVFF